VSTPQPSATLRAGLARLRRHSTGHAPDPGRLARRFRPWLVWLEGRTLLATVTITASASSAVFGQAITFSLAEVGGLGGGLFEIDEPDDYLLGSVAEGSLGTATLTLSNLPIGNFAITATYLSSIGTYEGMGTLDGGLPVSPDPTSTALSPVAPVVSGQAAMLAATVSAVAPGSGIPSGSVTFFEGSTSLGSTTLSGSGVATLSAALAGSGPRTITASYSGNGDFLAGSSGTINTLAGNGSGGSTGDGGPATSAQLNDPQGVAVDALGDVFIADYGNNVIREVMPDGIIRTVAGDGLAGFSGDGGPATSAKLDDPVAVAVDASGDLFIADYGNARIREVPSDGTIHTVAGTGVSGFSGDGGPATSAELGSPVDVAVDAAGDLFIADIGNQRIREVTPDGIIHTVAGDGLAGYSGDGGPATSAELNVPYGVAVDASGDLFIADDFNNRVREVTPDGIIHTIAGLGPAGFSGDGGPATSAMLSGPVDLAVDASGDVFISDYSNNRVREVTPDGTIRTVVGGGSSGLGDGGAATSAQLDGPDSIAVDASGRLFITDSQNNRVRVVGLQAVAQVATPTTLTLTSSSNPSSIAAPAVLTATVAATIPGSPTPQGVVDFFDGTVLVGSGLVNAYGQALAEPNLFVGPQDLTATFVPSDADDLTSTSAILFEIVTAPGLQLSASTNTPAIGQPVIFTANQAGGPLSGTVVFYQLTATGETALGSVPIVNGSMGSFIYPFSSLGTYQIGASFTLQGANAPLTYNVVPGGVTVVQSPTNISLQSGPSPSTYGQAVTIVAQVSTPYGGMPTGMVQFSEGSTVLGSAMIVNGSASLTISSLLPGAHTILASYPGDTDDLPTAALISQVVEQVSTQTYLSFSANPTYGMPLTLTATVGFNGAGPGNPTGQVEFLVDGQSFLASLNSAGVASYMLSSGLAVGPHTIYAIYGGDPNFSSSTSTTQGLNVAQASTTTQVFTSLSPTVYGQVATFRAVVTPSGQGTPTGVVQFFANGVSIGSASLGAGGIATLQYAGFPVGGFSITADYVGDANFLGGTSSNPVEQVVNQASTSTTVTSTTTGSFFFDETATFVTQVQAVAPGAGIPSGFVALDYDYLGIQGSFGTETLDASGRYSFSISLPFIGSLQVFAIYIGSADYVTSNSFAVAVPVGQASTTTAISSAPGPTVFGQPVTLKASIAVVYPGSGSPSGTVQFYDNGAAIGSPQPVANNQATLNVSNLAVGLQSITAQYSGSADFVASTATAFPQVVSPASTSVVLEPPSTALPAYGQALTFTALASAVAPGAGVPGGMVDFYDEAGLIGMAPLMNGVASFSDSVLPLGNHSVYAIYTSDADFLASPNSNPVAVTVTPAPTTSTLTVPTRTSTYGNSIQLEVSVKASPATFIPKGIVTFYDGSTVLGFATLDSLGTASLGTASTTLQAGANLITVAYLSSNGNNLPSTSPVVEVVVAPSPLTVVVNNQSMVYGGPLPTLTGTVLGVLGNDAIAATYTTTATSTSDVQASGYPITASLVATAGSLANYAVTIQAGTLTITPANQVITWTPPASIVYGTPLSATQLDATISVVGPAWAGALTYSPALGTFLNAGLGQTLTVTAAATIDYNPATFSVPIDVTPAPLSVLVDNQTNVYGAPLPVLTGTVSGVVNGDAVTAQYSTTATSASDVSTAGYPITAALVATQGSLANYAVTIQPGTLTVVPADQVISWIAPASIVYGTPLSATQLDATISVVGPAWAGALTYFPAPGSVLNAGLGQTLTVTAAGTIDYNPATYSVPIDVTPAPLTVTADSQSKLFGAFLPVLTGTITGLVNGDMIAASYSITATATSDVQGGGYPIMPMLVDPFGRLSNYSVTINPGVLTIAVEGTTLALSGAPTVAIPGQLPGTSVFGQSYTFTAVVSAVDSFGGVPTGSVNFIEGASLLGTSTLVNGVASFATTALPVGRNTIVAQYVPGTDFAGPSLAVASVVDTVARAKTTATVAASATSTTVGSTVFFQATVRAVAPGAGVPTGLVRFLVDGFALGSPVELVNGQAQTSTNKLTAGTHTINAYYLGGPNFLASALATGTVSILSTYAGTGNAGFSGDGGPAKLATFNQPAGVAVDLRGNVYIADTANNRIRMIAPNGIITTVAGTGVAGDTGDGGLATKAELNAPTAVAVDALGDLFIADTGNNAIREITKAGIILTVIGSGDAGAPVVLAPLQSPQGIAVDPQGLQLYVSDTGADMVLEVTQAGPVQVPGALAGPGPRRVVTVAGTGMPGAGPDGPADQSALYQPTGLALNRGGDLYIADTANNLVRMVTASTGMIETVAGKVGATANNDGGPATEAALHRPQGVAVNGLGFLYIADTGSDQVRVVTADGTINSIISGNMPGTSFQQPTGIASGPFNGVFIANTNANNILSIANLPTEGDGGAGGGGPGVEVFVGPLSSMLSSSNSIELTSQLLPLNSSSLELLATLSVMSIEFNIDATAETNSASALPNQPPPAVSQSSMTGAEETTEPSGSTEKPPAAPWSFIQYHLGLDPSAVQQAPAPSPAPAASPSSGEGLGMGDFPPVPAATGAFDEAIRSLALESPSGPDLSPEKTEVADLAVPDALAWTMTIPLGLITTGLRTPRPVRLVQKRGRPRYL
jgi:sugar lactone lactonase YvrE